VWQIAQSHEIAFIGAPESPTTAQIQKLKTKRETVQLKGKPASPASPQNINPMIYVNLFIVHCCQKFKNVNLTMNFSHHLDLNIFFCFVHNKYGLKASKCMGSLLNDELHRSLVEI